MAAGDLTTLDDVKALLGITDGKSDETLQARVSEASTRFQVEIGQVLALASSTDVMDGTGGVSLPLRRTPIVAVTAVAITDTAGATPRQIAVGNFVWSKFSVRLIAGDRFTKGYGNVAVSYQAGLAVIPLDISSAVMKLAAFMYRGKDRIGKTNEVIGGQTVGFETKSFPDDVLETIENYRRRAPTL